MTQRCARKRWMRAAAGLAVSASVLLASGAHAQPQQRHALARAVDARLSAAHLEGEPGALARIRHGRFTPADLATPALLAEAALSVGSVDHPVFMDPSVPPELRARALLARGEAQDAIDAVEGIETMGAERVRTEASFTLARYDDAEAATQRVIDRLLTDELRDAGEAADAARVMLVRLRLRGSEGDNGRDYQRLLDLLAGARTRLDRLDPRPRLAEALLLYEKHDRAKCAEALTEVLALNPSNAEALRLRGLLAVDGFDFETSELVAERLESLRTDAGMFGDRAHAGGASIAAAEIRARGLLRQRRADEAIEVLVPVASDFPRERTVLALLAASHAVGNDEAALRDALERLESLSPGGAAGPFEVGAALAEARQYDLAPEHLERAQKRLPNWSAPGLELGHLFVQAGDDDRATLELTEGLRLDPFDVRARNSLKLLEELRGYAMLETEHFRVRYKPGPDAVLARDMAARLDAIHERVTGSARGGADHTPTDKTLIELMPDHDRFSVRIAGMPDIWTMAAATGPVIAFESPREGPGHMAGPYDWARVVQHEFSHTTTLHRTRNRIPHWYTEAWAVFHEDAPRDGRTWDLLAQATAQGKLFDLDAINVAFVRPEQPSDRALAYAQSEWMLEFMFETYGEEAPRAIMDRFAAGDSPSEAWEAVLGVPPASFLGTFEAWALEELRDVGMAPREGEPTVGDLLEGEREAMGLDEAPELSREMVDRWLGERPDNPAVLELAVGFALQERGGEVDEGMAALLDRYARARPGDSLPHRLLTRVYLGGETTEERARAIPHLRHLDEREIHTPAFARELAELHAEVGAWPAAFTSAERAVGIEPFDPALREMAAALAIKAGALGDAERHVLALTELEPQHEIHARSLEALRALIERQGGG
ncbi:MAG: hypothetical protein AAF356_05475 [Planctomycetota bacterium]